MHLIATVVTFFAIIGFTFANPITPIGYSTLSSVYTNPTTTHTHLQPTYTHVIPHHSYTHTSHHSYTHTMIRPTGTYHPSVYYHPSVHPKQTATPAATPAVYGRDDAEADKYCTHYQCTTHLCMCLAWGGDASVEPVVDYVDEATLTVREEVSTVFVLADRDGAATNDECHEACFWNSCECIPNAGGKSATLRKTLMGLALAGAAVAAAGLV
jgi:hypothetical protein